VRLLTLSCYVFSDASFLALAPLVDMNGLSLKQWELVFGPLPSQTGGRLSWGIPLWRVPSWNLVASLVINHSFSLVPNFLFPTQVALLGSVAESIVISRRHSSGAAKYIPRGREKSFPI
jgi:hypothetical protein